MKTGTVPDFFRGEDAASLRAQAQWLNDRLGLGDHFLSRLLNESEAKINVWRSTGTGLQLSSEKMFRDFWKVVLHLLSHYNFDENLVRSLLDDAVSLQMRPQTTSPLGPPWAGSSLRAFFEGQPSKAIFEVSHWVMSFRFGDPYVPPVAP